MNKLIKFMHKTGVSTITVEGRQYKIDRHPRIYTGKVAESIKELARVNRNVVYFDASNDEVAEYYSKYGTPSTNKLSSFSDAELEAELLKRQNSNDETVAPMSNMATSVSINDDFEPTIEADVPFVKPTTSTKKK